MKHHRPFLALWVLAASAAVLAFVLHLAMRGRTMALGYELGKVRAEQARLREVKRVLELEVASYQTPQRVEAVARSVLHMEPPAAERILSMPAPGQTRPLEDVALPAADRPLTRTAQRNKGSPFVPTSSSPAASAPPADLVVPRITPPKTALPAGTTTGAAEPPP